MEVRENQFRDLKGREANVVVGIIQCDMIAKAIIAAAQNFHDIPIVVRLQGTNAAQGQKLVGYHRESR